MTPTRSIFYFINRRLEKRIASLVLRLTQNARILYYKSISTLEVKGKPGLNQPLHAIGSGELIFDGKVSIGVFPSPTFLSSHAYIEARNVGSSVKIGNGTWINNGFIAIAEHKKITIGSRCLIGPFCEILDSDFHGINISDRNRSSSVLAKSVTLEDDVFLGANVKILKGVTIGRGSVVANGSVVTKSIPPLTVAGGNPARIIKSITE